jgi:transposase
MAGSVVVSGPESLSHGDLLVLVGVQDRMIAEQKAQIAELVARLAELERRLNRHSGNSSMPPSSDVFVRPEKPKAVKSGRKRGKQPGAGGSGLALVGDPDRLVDVFPPACGGCGVGFAGLEAADSSGFTRRQCHDVPAVTVEVTETRWHEVRCGCGHVTAAQVGAGVPDVPVYGPGLRALAVYLLVFQHVPVERTALLIRDVTGAEVSTGWVSGLLSEAAGLVAPSLDLIRALLVLGHVLHADETTTRVRGKKVWLHVACTRSLTLLHLASRSRAGANAGGVLPGFRGTLVHDALSLYDVYDAEHQLCASHVIRELTEQAEHHPGEHWAEQIRWSLSEMVKVARAARDEGLRGIPPERLRRWLVYYDSGVHHGLDLHPIDQASAGQSKATNLLLRLRDRRDAYLRFTVDLTVEPTNNQGERDLRPVKTQVKISGTHASEAGAANWLAVRSYLSSAAKNGVGAFEAMRRAFTGELWMPPIALEP